MSHLPELRAFIRLVEVRSFTQVARELRVKQSTISKWLAAMEAELGVQLIDRTTRSHRVTEAGRLFYESAKQMVDAYDSAVAALQEDQSTLRGRLRLSLPVVFGKLYVVPLVARFLRLHPELEVEMQLTDRYVSLVEEGFDLAIRVGVPSDSSLISHNLGNCVRRLVASPEYLKRRGTPQTPSDLAQHHCLAHTELSTNPTWVLSKAGQSHRVAVRGRASVNNSEAALALCKSGLGVCLLASWLVDTEISAGHLLELMPTYVAPAAPVCALSPPGHHLPRRTRALVEFLRTELKPALKPLRFHRTKP